MNLPIRLFVAASAAFVSLASLPGCSSAPRAGAVDTKALENAPFVGAWTSDLDAATLSVEPPRAAPGESVVITLRLADEESAQEGPATVPVEIVSGDGTAVTRVDLVREGDRATATVPVAGSPEPPRRPPAPRASSRSCGHAR